ncbi:hypothetical protein FACS189431_6980 [Alphaproteobacteria bacterium]|nr:hypothetical protein FACS189431_6980 [Alphaproteobacteria bacterium]
MKDMKIEKTMTFHVSRHTWRTIAARKGIRDTIAERIMGHAEGKSKRESVQVEAVTTMSWLPFLFWNIQFTYKFGDSLKSKEVKSG